MTNGDIASLLQEIADLLELTDVSRFEVIAYQNAARTIEYYELDLADIYKKEGIDGLKKIQGIGDTISHNVAEYIEKGKSSKRDSLIKKIPKVELDINAIPGVGPKTTKKLYHALKPKSISDLAKKLNSKDGQKKLEKLSILEKSIDNILRGIDLKKRISGRIPIGVALPIAQEFVSALLSFPGVLSAEAVGSLRRMKETVGDIDIIASCDAQSRNIIENFIILPSVKTVIAKGTTKATIMTHDDLQVDLEILPQAEYGSLLQHFTGSKEHNVALRTWGTEHGFSISEHGIKIAKNEKVKSKNHSIKLKTEKTKIIKCKDEQCVYKTLGMDWIPPELRENQGEIQAALKHTLPKLVELKDIKGDLQMHTRASDGHATIEQMADAAIKIGYQYIGITDHSIGIGITGGLDSKGLDHQRKEINRVNNINRNRRPLLQILQGSEVNIRSDGRLDLPDDVLAKLDFAIAAIHSSFSRSRSENTKRYLNAIKNPHVDIIAHPTGRMLGRREAMDIDWKVIFSACKIHHTALEINAGIDRLDLPDYLAKQAASAGVMLIIDTDSHSPDALTTMCFGIAQARRAWLTKNNILNTMDIDKLTKWFNHNA